MAANKKVYICTLFNQKIYTTWIYLKNSEKIKAKSGNGWTRFMVILLFRNWKVNWARI